MNRFMKIAIFVLASFAVGCSTKFTRLEPSQLNLGSDTLESITQKMGKPRSEAFFTKDKFKMKTINYFYFRPNEDPVYPGIMTLRGQAFSFHQNKLVGYNYMSTAASDNTDFNESKLDEIIIGTTTIQEVTGLLGDPTGEAIYPIVTNKTDRGHGYFYFQIRLGLTTTYQKALSVSYDVNGIVTGIDYSEIGTK